MSMCGNCHYNIHADEECNGECTFADAVYAEQWAYDQLESEFFKYREAIRKILNEDTSVEIIYAKLREFHETYEKTGEI